MHTEVDHAPRFEAQAIHGAGAGLVSLAWFWMLHEVDSVLMEDRIEQIRRSGGV